nr:MAG TPA: DNA binding protein [Caudoviricetes sp.]
MLKQICDVLTALRQYLHQAHLCAQDKGYAAHLLLNDLYERVSEDIDRLKELYIGSTGDTSIANAESSLLGALKYVRALEDAPDFNSMLKNCLVLEKTGDELIRQGVAFYTEKPVPFAQGILNALGDVDERRLKEVYLLNTEISL